MGLLAKACDKVRKESVNKIHGQLTDHDTTTLKKELVSIAASIPSGLRGGNHGHAEIIVETTKYLTMAGVAFNNPIHPGIYPAGLAANAAAGTQAREEAEHK
jgi:hypothetical protein